MRVHGCVCVCTCVSAAVGSGKTREPTKLTTITKGPLMPLGLTPGELEEAGTHLRVRTEVFVCSEWQAGQVACQTPGEETRPSQELT